MTTFSSVLHFQLPSFISVFHCFLYSANKTCFNLCSPLFPSALNIFALTIQFYFHLLRGPSWCHILKLLCIGFLFVRIQLLRMMKSAMNLIGARIVLWLVLIPAKQLVMVGFCLQVDLETKLTSAHMAIEPILRTRRRS